MSFLCSKTNISNKRTKNIQSIPNNSGNVEDTEVQSENESQSKSDAEKTNDEPQSSNTIPFPSKTTKNVNVVPETDAETLPQAYGQGQHIKRVPGEYKALNEGLVTATAIDDNLHSNHQSIDHPDQPD